jgi:putative transposase
MRKTFKYRLYSSENTFRKTEEWLDLCRFLYNCALEQRISVYKSSHKSISYYEQQNELPLIKEIMPEYKDVGSQTLQDVLRKLDKAYKAFFRRVKKGEGKVGFPRFKGRDRFDSFTLTQANWKLEGKYLYITKLGRFKLKLSRPIQGNIKSITIKRSLTNKWYACFSCDSVPENKLPKLDTKIGIDVGIKSYLTDSEGNKVENPKFLKYKLRELRVKQRKLARAKKGSNRCKGTKLQVAKLHEKIANQRNDFLHKLANNYVSKYGVIKVENLQIKNMTQNHKLARDINDCSWGKFYELLSYKAEEAGRQVIKVKPHNTSRKCNKCGLVNHDLKLSDRVWICENCGTTHDRDENAAINISEVRAEPLVANVGQKIKRKPRIIEKCGVSA